APRMASVMAWARISASEWPSSPNSQGTVTPPKIRGLPVIRRWTSQPRPVRISLKVGFFRGLFAEEKVGEVHVAGLGDLDVAITTGDDAHFHIHALDEAGLVGADEAVFAGGAKGAHQQVVAEDLRGLCHHQFL